jgi:ABC-2 type transport system permease protein
MNRKISPSKSNLGLRQSARIIWAIVAKDILEALKNKNTIAIILTSMLMLVFYYYLPILGTSGEPPRVRVYDAGDSILVALLENSETFDVRTYPSQEKMFEALRDNDTPVIGLVIPAGFDSALESAGAAQLQGYVLSWVEDEKALELQRTLETEITSLIGQPVPVQMEGNRIGLDPDSQGIGSTAALAVVFVVVMIGLTLIPHLMLEEKSSRTMDVLLVSPASAGNLVAGKAIVGLFYCLLGALVALLVFHFVVVHWWLTLLAVILGALLTISLGLWLGTIIESRAQLTLWAWVFILPLLLPVFLSLMKDLFPGIVAQVLQILPAAVMLNLLRTSFSSSIPLGSTLLMLAWLAAWAAAGLFIVTWLVHRQDRRASVGSAFRKVETQRMKPVTEGMTRWFAPFVDSLSSWRRERQAPDLDDIKPETEVGGTRKHSSWRIIWTIAAKDIYAALKNKLTLSIMLGAVLIVASSTVPRMLLKEANTPAAIVYDPGRSTILRALSASEDLRLGITDSQEEMQEIVSTSQEMLLGLVVSKDFDSLADSSDLIELDGYAVHWADQDKADQWVTFFQDQIGQVTWGKVQINLSEQRLYPPAEPRGGNALFVLLAVVTMLTMGLALVPLLLVEERSAHTLEVLLVSPARIYEVVAGKALAGGFYCLLALLVVFFLNRYLVVNWGMVVLAVLLGVAFAVLVGLLVGVLSDNPTTVGLWGGLLLVALLGLTMFSTLADFGLPPVIQTLLDYLPTTALADLFSYSLADEFPVTQMWVNSAALLLEATAVSGLLFWRLRSADR